MLMSTWKSVGRISALTIIAALLSACGGGGGSSSGTSSSGNTTGNSYALPSSVSTTGQ
jgi:hypothetical protein